MKPGEELYQQSRRMVDAEIRRSSHLSSHDLFRRCWAIIEDNSDRFKVRAELSGMTDRSWRVLVYFDFIVYFSRNRPDFSPPMRGIDPPAGATVVATVHTGLEIGIAKALADKGRKVSVIRWFNARNSPRRAAFKLPGSIEAIEADANSLIHARRSLAEGRLLLADCDHPLPDNPRSAESIRVISNAIFELAKRSGAKLCFVLPYIDKHGLITFRVETIESPLRREIDYRTLFVEFLNRSGMNWISWKL